VFGKKNTVYFFFSNSIFHPCFAGCEVKGTTMSLFGRGGGAVACYSSSFTRRVSLRPCFNMNGVLCSKFVYDLVTEACSVHVPTVAGGNMLFVRCYYAQQALEAKLLAFLKPFLATLFVQPCCSVGRCVEQLRSALFEEAFDNPLRSSKLVQRPLWLPLDHMTLLRYPGYYAFSFCRFIFFARPVDCGGAVFGEGTGEGTILSSPLGSSRTGIPTLERVVRGELELVSFSIVDFYDNALCGWIAHVLNNGAPWVDSFFERKHFEDLKPCEQAYMTSMFDGFEASSPAPFIFWERDQDEWLDLYHLFMVFDQHCKRDGGFSSSSSDEEQEDDDDDAFIDYLVNQ
jgi:hypothetical protein